MCERGERKGGCGAGRTREEESGVRGRREDARCEGQIAVQKRRSAESDDDRNVRVQCAPRRGCCSRAMLKTRHKIALPKRSTPLGPGVLHPARHFLHPCPRQQGEREEKKKRGRSKRMDDGEGEGEEGAKERRVTHGA